MSVSDLPALARFVKENRVGLTVVGPDETLAAGIVDLFLAEGLRIFGPSKAAARIESSKIFAKELMRKEGIPTARAGTFDRSADAIRFCEELRFPIVVKADGLALGKGVVITPDAASAKSTIDEMMNQDSFGEAESSVVIEKVFLGKEWARPAFVGVENYCLSASERRQQWVV